MNPPTPSRTPLYAVPSNSSAAHASGNGPESAANASSGASGVSGSEMGQNTPRLCRLGDLLGDWESEAAAIYEAKQSGRARGPVSGFRKLDEELGHCFAPGVHIVHGQPGAGKSAFALQVAANCGCTALYVSCEMAPLELLARHTARVTGLYLGRLKSGELSPQDSVAAVRRAIGEAPQLCLIDATAAPASPQYLYDCAQIARRDGAERGASPNPHLLLVVDSVQSWAEGMNTGSTEYETLNAALMSLRTLAHRLRCPILAVSERNRESMSGGGLSAGAGSRKIEYGAETVIDLSRDADARPDGNGELPLKLRLAKNRHGAAGKTIGLTFNGALQRFKEAD